MKIFIKLLFVISFSYASVVSVNDIESIALNFINQKNPSNMQYTVDKITKVDNLYFIDFNPSGFVIMSSYKNTIPVLGYSFSNNLNLLNLPVQLSQIIDSYNQGINFAVQNDLGIDNKILQEWDSYIDGFQYRENTRSNIEPLIDANWNQGGAWNNLCPGNSLVGCVAVAMGQVMYYWEHPNQGSGYSQYYDPEYGIISVVFSDFEYNFNNMNGNSATYDSQLLLYHAGVAVHMNYTPWASGASVCWDGPSAQSALDDNFNYNDEITCEVKVNYSDEEWHSLILDQLERGWPMVYRGYSDDAGHAWNIDGYQDGYFHCNWGWGGSANGYFYFDSLNGGGYNFIDNQAALLNIIPDNLYNPSALFDYSISDMLVQFNDLSAFINDDLIDSFLWDFGDGNFSTEQSPLHEYDEYGSYIVSLIVTSEYGLDSEQHIEFIDIFDMTGDVNNDNIINVIDIVALVEIILLGPESANDSSEYTDINEDGNVNIIDVISLVNIILD